MPIRAKKLTSKRVVFAARPTPGPEAYYYPFTTRSDVCPNMTLKLIRWSRRPCSKYLFHLFCIVALAGSLVLTLLHASGEPGSTRDFTPYAQCEIIFLEVAAKSVLDPRHACSIESAARAHPNATVCLAMSIASYTTLGSLKPIKKQFKNIDNLFVVPLDFSTMFRWTPLDNWYHEEFQFTTSVWRVVHLSDATRLAFLWKYGGLYLDLDTLVLQPLLNQSRNFIGIQHFSNLDGVNSAVMRFERHHPFLSKWLYAVPSKFDEHDRASIGPLLVTKLIFPYCQGDLPESSKRLESLSDKACDFDLEIKRPEALYPIPWPEWKSIFKTDSSSSSVTMSRINQSLTLHMWNELSSRLRVDQIDPGSAFMALAQTHCPKTYLTYLAPEASGKPMNPARLKTILKWAQRGGSNNHVLAPSK